MSNSTKPEVGDWVRFYSGGSLIIGVVCYVTRSIVGKTEVHTDVGTVNAECIHEIRKP